MTNFYFTQRTVGVISFLYYYTDILVKYSYDVINDIIITKLRPSMVKFLDIDTPLPVVYKCLKQT